MPSITHPSGAPAVRAGLAAGSKDRQAGIKTAGAASLPDLSWGSWHALRQGGPWLLSPPFSTDITIKVEDPDCLSSSSYRDVENERFLSSSSSTARRVSFNEAALFDQGKKTQEKGRR